MPALLAAMDEALKEAGASADKARKAAEVVANDDNWFASGCHPGVGASSTPGGQRHLMYRGT